MTEAPKVLLSHHLKMLKLPNFLREYGKLARQCAIERLDHVQFRGRLVELELIDRERLMNVRRIKAATFPAFKSLDSFDFKAIRMLNKMQELELARFEWIDRRKNVIALGPSGPGIPTLHWALVWPLARRARRAASPPQPLWSTDLWWPATSAGCFASRSRWPASSCSSSANCASSPVQHRRRAAVRVDLTTL